MAIMYLSYEQIDKIKWDACIERSENGLIYANSFYLDAMAKHWDALVLNDYETVMPLTWNRKYGIYYLYQPPFTACLGVFGNRLTASVINDFLLSVPKKFRYWDISLNHCNLFSVPGFKLYERMNYVLPLNNSYEILYSGFRESTQRNIKKASQLNCTVKKDIPVREVIKLSKGQSVTFAALPDDAYNRLEKLFEKLNRDHRAITYGVYGNNKLFASAVFFICEKRAYYILVGNHPDGKTTGASHTLINAFIKDHAGENMVLDFEGSDIPNLAMYYISFGAVREKYAAIRLNRLPPFLKWFKKN